MKAYLFYFLIFIITLRTSETSKSKIPIGLVYCNLMELARAEEIVMKLNSETSINSKYKYKFEIKGLKLSENDNPISLSISVCQNLMNKEPIYALIIANSDCLKKGTDNASSDNDILLTLSSISLTCAYYQIPVIDLKTRDAAFSDEVTKNSTQLEI